MDRPLPPRRQGRRRRPSTGCLSGALPGNSEHDDRTAPTHACGHSRPVLSTPRHEPPGRRHAVTRLPHGQRPCPRWSESVPGITISPCLGGLPASVRVRSSSKVSLREKYQVRRS
jgi:hypothetical protein